MALGRFAAVTFDTYRATAKLFNEATMFFLGSPVKKPEDTIVALAQGEKHWRKGYSAYELAYSWVGAGDIPARVRAVLDQAPELVGARLVEAFFEKETELRSRGRPSQTDLLALIATAHGFAVVGIEGKANEPFGQLVRDWRDGGQGKETRLGVLCETLDLDFDAVGPLRYQLLHRTVATIYEAQRYGADCAAMLVHSFSAGHRWFDDFQQFAAALGIPVSQSDEMSGVIVREGVTLRIGWVSDLPST